MDIYRAMQIRSRPLPGLCISNQKNSRSCIGHRGLGSRPLPGLCISNLVSVDLVGIGTYGSRPLPGLCISNLMEKFGKIEKEEFSSPSGAVYFKSENKIINIDDFAEFSSPSGAVYFKS